ncbi:MAG: hypothetical protein H6965_04145 [Chromatiaceae bacterium]|nr:hypothetical protein [Chromatiaceae bacterium]
MPSSLLLSGIISRHPKRLVPVAGESSLHVPFIFANRAPGPSVKSSQDGDQAAPSLRKP